MEQSVMSEVLIPISFFLSVFGIVYLYLSTRNKERLALIEKGADASIFMRNRSNSPSTGKILLLNLALLLMAIGLGVFIASFLVYNLGVDEDVAYPGTIFLISGIGLFTGFFMTKKLEKENE